MTVLIK